MVKEPRPGRVKTRLARDIGTGAAAWWFRRQALTLLARLDDPRWRLHLAVSPDREGLASRIWPAHLPRIPQGRGDLGARMLRLLRHPAPGPVLVVGADIPGMTRARIADAFAQLGRHDAVLGPATDGGYWLVGLKRTAAPPPWLFRGVRWSSPHALADTLASAPELSWGRAATLSDVDTAADLPDSR
ncbi:TIGR04282 family arsenosugar biosynthesis glycosyltransferase [Oceaniglobus roseus]|uniref:TIGR04282 family arsenosugar biosynthesis glycosyltransferase n=1 Tax=Oceaniglobus roseus TaxID=1737570 RepID=UPI000C7F0957|nr:TIGR04282 family arsenosugar biosynthesis glycosyltransferase [Kandeliimicrobium roseum]